MPELHRPGTRFNIVAIAYALWLGVAIGFLAPYLATLDGLRDATGNLLGRDFANMWAGAQAVAQNAVPRLFEVESFRAFQNGLFGFALPPHNWSYPPQLLLFLAPLALVSYPLAFGLWSLLGLAAYLFAALRARAGKLEIAALALAPASLVNLVTGQNGFFTAALLWVGLKSLRGNPVLAGIAFGLLTLKPQIGILLPFVLVVGRHWIAILSAIATAAAICAAAALAFGPESFAAYVTQSLPFQTYTFTETRGIFMSMMPTAFMNARIAGLDAEAAWLVQAPFTLAGVTLAIWTWRRTDETVLRAAVLLAGTFLASPYLFVYDLVAVTPVLIALWPHVGVRPGPRLILGLVWALPPIAIALGLAGIPLSAGVMAALALWLTSFVQESRPGRDPHRAATTPVPRLSAG